MKASQTPPNPDSLLDSIQGLLQSEGDPADTVPADTGSDLSAQASEGLRGLLEGVGAGELASVIHTILNFPIFTISDTSVTPMLVLLVGLVVVITWWVSNLLQRWIERAFKARGLSDPGTTAVVKRLLHYLVMAIGLAIALDTLGISLGALFAAGAIFAVGIGFAMQNIAQNFVSGLILLIERAIKPGDIVEAEGRVVRVLKMGIRSTVARTRDDEEIIIPNSSLVQTAVKNFTLDDPLYRLRIEVGVAYESDMQKVRETLTDAVGELEGRVKDRDPVVLLTQFGDSSVVWQVSAWTNDAWRAPKLASDLREAVWWALKDQGITIAFPQLDVHFDPPIDEGFRGSRSSEASPD